MPRAGTTSLATWLALHPDVSLSKPKEPGYYATDLAMDGAVRTAAAYEACFAHTPDARWRLDATVWYLYSREAIPAIARVDPSARIIVSVRDLAEMITSLHTKHLLAGFETEVDLMTALTGPRRGDPADFRIGLDYLGVARFAEQTRRLFAHFPSSQVHVIDFRRLQRHPERVHAELLDFLDLAPAGSVDYRVRNPGRTVWSGGLQRAIETMHASRRSRPVRRALWALSRLNRRRIVTDPPPEVRALVAEELSADVAAVATTISQRATRRG